MFRGCSCALCALSFDALLYVLHDLAHIAGLSFGHVEAFLHVRDHFVHHPIFLEEKIDARVGFELFHEPLVARARENNDGDRCAPLVCAEKFERFDPAHDGHHDIEHDEVGVLGKCGVESDLAILGFEDSKSLIRKRIGDDRTQKRRVFNDQDGFGVVHEEKYSKYLAMSPVFARQKTCTIRETHSTLSMRSTRSFSAAFALVLFGGIAGAHSAIAASACDGIAKPVYTCPSKYSQMCIPSVPPYWGCGAESSAGLAVSPTNEEIANAKAVGGTDGGSVLLPLWDEPVYSSGRGTVGQRFVLDATVSQDDGLVKTFNWKQVSGPAAVIENAKAATASFVPSTAGTYVFEVHVTDVIGDSWVLEQTTVTVASAPVVATTTTKAIVPRATRTITGDPDFDFRATTGGGVILQPKETDLNLVPANPPSSETKPATISQPVPRLNLGDVDRDGALDRKIPASASGTAAQTAISGDPDFDLLAITVADADLDQLREDALASDAADRIRKRGWDVSRKEEIIGKPDRVRTERDLRIYTEATALADPDIKKITIDKEAIRMERRERGKLFWVIPVEMTAEVVIRFAIRDSTSDPVNVRLPWWSVFVKKPYREREIEQEARRVHESSIWEKLDNSEEPSSATRASRALYMTSNILRTKHDTAKNAIGNIR